MGSEIYSLASSERDHEVSFAIPDFKRPPQSLPDFQISVMKDQLASFQPDLLINTSGPINISESFEARQLYVEDPVRQIRSHLRAISESGSNAKYLFLSSGAIYGSTSPVGARENDLPNPLSPYAEGKLAAEAVIQTLIDSGEFGNSALIVRAFSLYSPNLRARVLDRIFSVATRGEPAEFFGTGAEIRDYVSMNALWMVIKRFLAPSQEDQLETLNLSTGYGLSVSSLIDIARESLEGRCRFPEVSFNGLQRMGDPDCMVGNSEKLSQFLGSWSENPVDGLAEYFEMRTQ